MTKELQTRIMRNSLQVREGDEEEPQASDFRTENFEQYLVRELMQEDWRDLIASFYFLKQSQMVSDERIRFFLESTD